MTPLLLYHEQAWTTTRYGSTPPNRAGKAKWLFGIDLDRDSLCRKTLHGIRNNQQTPRSNEAVLFQDYFLHPGVGRLYPPPSNPRLDGQRIYTAMQKYPSFIHRPALGWTVAKRVFSIQKTNKKCTRSLLSQCTNWYLLDKNVDIVCRSNQDAWQSMPTFILGAGNLPCVIRQQERLFISAPRLPAPDFSPPEALCHRGGYRRSRCRYASPTRRC